MYNRRRGGMTFCKFNAYLYIRIYNPAIDLDFDVSFAVAFPRLRFVRYTRVRRIRNGGPCMYNSRKKSPASSRVQFPLVLPATATEMDVLFFIRDVDFAARYDCRERTRPPSALSRDKGESVERWYVTAVGATGDEIPGVCTAVLPGRRLLSADRDHCGDCASAGANPTKEIGHTRVHHGDNYQRFLRDVPV